MKFRIFGVLLATVLAGPVFADDDDTQGGLRFQPGVQITGFAMAGDRDDLTWGMGLQGTLFTFGQLSLLGPGISLHELKSHWAASPYVELVTIDFTEGPGTFGVTFIYVFRNAFGGQGAPLDHGIGVGIVIGGP